MEVAHSAGAIVYFEPSAPDGDLFDDALALTTILKYSSDRLGPEIDERLAASAALALVTYRPAGHAVPPGHERHRSGAVSSGLTAPTRGSGAMVRIGRTAR